MRIKEVIVVEGKDDTAKIKQAVDADTIETNGSAINHKILTQIKHAKDVRGVIVFTDPDYPGQRIRSIINEQVPGCKHAFLTKDDARDKHDRGIGIEHASKEAIQKALEAVYEVGDTYRSDIEKEDLMRYGLIGGTYAREKREALTTHLNIGYANGKQLMKRLTMFHITKSDLKTAMKEIEKENGDV
ncbi:ribonuclease M5 [Halolactibacillus miurensis]|uniref:Ribonuclease M5 n=1 Tax=Halolactibacillus miurensis TaxID=306541 RepID=A0A1I6TI76_9BACI|nr:MULTISPECIES: ribonuclease M5 [Halolactibacillus]GEM04680.1 ribonuclease M5 [Halolactibacillus miurensis]SFS88875.1 ribonuclease M5 [Halolactibacillus miurensis]